MSALQLYGFEYSVYVRAVRMALAHLGVAYDLIPLDPFDPDMRADNPHPMHRVPVLRDGDFTIFETAAILTYLARRHDPALIPEGAKAHSRMVQVQGIVDAYAYWPLVRQVYAKAVFPPADTAPRDAAEITRGLRAARPALAMIEGIAAEGLVLTGQRLSLADFHLAPMIAAFAAAPEGAEVLSEFPALSLWWLSMEQRDFTRASEPDLSALRQDGPD